MQTTRIKKFKAVYIEITNICNLNCSFCIGTKRTPKFMTTSDFGIIAKKVKRITDYIYLHVLGEPLLHSNLKDILELAKKEGLIVNITTNGTLLKEKKDILLHADNVRKVGISLHSFEGNDRDNGLLDYLESVYDFVKDAKCIVELRLWNGKGKNTLNAQIEEFFSQKLNVDICSVECKNNAKKIRDNLFFAYADVFEWPDVKGIEKDVHFCHGLDTHFGILVDGTIIPCCLDSEGTICLGNALIDDIEKVILGERATSIINGFKDKKPTEDLCKKCGYATRFK